MAIWCICFISVLISLLGILRVSSSLIGCSWLAPLTPAVNVMRLYDASSSSFLFIILVPSSVLFFTLLVLLLLHVCLHYMEASYMGLNHNLEMHPWCCVFDIYGNHEKLVVGGGAKNLIVHYEFCDYWCSPSPCEKSTSWVYPSISYKNIIIVKTKKKQNKKISNLLLVKIPRLDYVLPSPTNIKTLEFKKKFKNLQSHTLY